jgi:squalene synthase HpnC
VALPVTHYENFPVASLLCPPHLRQPIAAIYGFARTADDIADEGDALPAARLADLAAYLADLRAIAQGQAPSPRWASVFLPLQGVLRSHQLPVPLLEDLLSAFAQDVEKTRDGEGYADRDELLDYCRRSANPVGRLLLHLYGVHDAQALRQSDAICTALQLINFWQDVEVDWRKYRIYIPQADMERFGVTEAVIAAGEVTPQFSALMDFEIQRARTLMLQGAPLARKLPGRIGWELRLVVQGGLAILDKIEGVGYDVFTRRPALGKTDWLRLIWRAATR